jgi:3-deoxy-manno-octulosonate cytidylyltransferase (CMP-KDO synthetase)
MKASLATELPGRSRVLRAVAILPARLASTRLPRKMLLRETGRYLFEHSALAVRRCPAIARVVVAVDAPELLAAAREVGLEAVPTSPEHPSGTDRVHEAWKRLESEGERAEVVLGVQADEPELEPADLGLLVAAFVDPEVELATLWAPLEAGELDSRSAVKVVLDARGDALYFSRAPIPDRSHARPDAAAAAPRRHLGVYAFRPDALERFCSLPPGELERQENLEQLRWLESGRRIRVLQASRPAAGIDTPEDYARFVARIRARETSDPREQSGPCSSEKDRVRT